jgi:hypothetical protein
MSHLQLLGCKKLIKQYKNLWKLFSEEIININIFFEIQKW